MRKKRKRKECSKVEESPSKPGAREQRVMGHPCTALRGIWDFCRGRRMTEAC